MSMDLAALKGYALALREKIEEFADDEDVAALGEELGAILEDAVAGKILEPMELEDVPGAMMFEDGIFDDYEGLEDAYADFQIEVTGGESDYDDDMDDEDDDK